MSGKVKLPKEVCDALDELTEYEFYKTRLDVLFSDIYFHNERIKKRFPSFYDANLKFENVDIMRALVLGYEPELTPEEQLKERYENRGDYCTYEHFQGYRDGVKDALHLHGIKYDWITGWGEDDAE